MELQKELVPNRSIQADTKIRKMAIAEMTKAIRSPIEPLGPGQRRGRQSPAQEGGREEHELKSLQPGQRHGAQATRKPTAQAPPTSTDTSLPGAGLFSEA